MSTPGGAGQPALQSPAGEDHDQGFAEFCAAHLERVRRYLIGAYRCSEADADDALQDSVLAVGRYWERFRTREKPVAYLYKAAGRRLQRQLGRRAQHEAGGDSHELLGARPNPADAFAAVDDYMTVMALLFELPLRQRQVLWLRRAAAFTEAETAQILSIRPGTVKSQLHDAETRLRELLQKSSDTWEAKIR